MAKIWENEINVSSNNMIHNLLFNFILIPSRCIFTISNFLSIVNNQFSNTITIFNNIINNNSDIFDNSDNSFNNALFISILENLKTFPL